MICGKYQIMIWAFNNFCRKKRGVIIFPCSLPKRVGKVSGSAFDATHTTQGIKLQEKGGMNALNGTHMVLMYLVAVWQQCIFLCFRVLRFFVHTDLSDELLIDLHLNLWLLWGCLQRNGVTSVTCRAWKNMTCREGKTCQAGFYRRGNVSKTHSPHSQQ